MVKIFYFAGALADTFYSIGFVMSLCQLLSFLELFHIADGIEKARLLPRFIQVCITAQHLDGKKSSITNYFLTVHVVCCTGYGEEPSAGHGHNAGRDTEQTNCVCAFFGVEFSGSLAVCVSLISLMPRFTPSNQLHIFTYID